MEVIILKSDDCPHCQELMDRIKEQGGVDGKEIEFVDALTEDGRKLAIDLEIEEVPTAIVKGSNAVCKLVYVNDKVEVICPGDGNE